MQCVHAVNSWNYFNEIFKNRYLQKFRPSKIQRYTDIAGGLLVEALDYGSKDPGFQSH